MHQVHMIVVVVPSRDTIGKYAERKRLIDETISRINSLFVIAEPKHETALSLNTGQIIKTTKPGKKDEGATGGS